MIPIRIAGTGSALPRRSLETRQLVEAAFPGADPAALRKTEDRTGISTRHWIEPGETAAGLATQAMRAALERAALEPVALRRIVLASSTGGDHLVPATATDVAGNLGLSDSCDAFDISNSCVGFLSAFDIGARSVGTGTGPVGVVAVETFSRNLSTDGPRAYVVLGDAAAAAVLVPAKTGGMVASHLRVCDQLRGKMTMAIPGAAGARPYHDFDARTRDLTESAFTCIGKSINQVLATAELSLEQIDWVLVHQPNGSLFQELIRALRISPEKTVPIVREVGSIGSASVPTSLDRLMRTRPIQKGHRILMASVGAGTSYGAIVYEVG